MNFYVLLNHELTDSQIAEVQEMGANSIIQPPQDIKDFWANVAPAGDLPLDTLRLVTGWLAEGSAGDYVLAQGDFGATYYVVNWCFANGRIPVYATTGRVYQSQPLPDGSIRQTHIIKHVNFRNYLEAL